jgi:hypothetical protein
LCFGGSLRERGLRPHGFPQDDGRRRGAGLPQPYALCWLQRCRAAQNPIPSPTAKQRRQSVQ